MNPSGLINLVPVTVQKRWKNTGQYPQVTIFDAFQEQVKKQPDSLAVCSPSGNYKYSDIYRISLNLAERVVLLISTSSIS